MKILLLDNYDSFTFNLLHLLEQFDGVEVCVFRNDEITMDQVPGYDRIVLSPGPGLPEDAGITMQLIKEFHQRKSILGICLGHQAIAQSFGGKLFNLATVQHGISTETIVVDKSEELFQNIPDVFKTGRYHSWIVDRSQLPDCLKITAVDQKQNIMGLRHTTFDVRGIQFHPESILTEHGKTLIGNWLNS